MAFVSSVTGDVSILLGNSDGNLIPNGDYPVGGIPQFMATGDFNGDKKLDLAVAAVSAPGASSGTLTILLGGGNSTFEVGDSEGILLPQSMVAGDFTGNGRDDLAMSDVETIDQYNGDSVQYSGIGVFLSNRDGSFGQATSEYGPLADLTDQYANADFGALAVANFNGDGKDDLAADDELNDNAVIFLGNGDGTFSNASQLDEIAHATPVVADLTGDGVPDVLVINGAGDILCRQGISGDPGSFLPPVTVNPGNPSRDIADFNTSDGPVLASVDALDQAVTLYMSRAGAFIRVGSLPTGVLPAQIISADLTGDGLDDLVVQNAGAGTLSVFLAAKTVGPVNLAGGAVSFLPPLILNVGLGVSDVQAIDTTRNGRLDLVVTNRVTSDVTVLFNQGNGTFSPPAVYRGGTGFWSVSSDAGFLEGSTSVDATSGVAAGTFTGGGLPDLVTINPGLDTLSVIAGLGGQRFANPVTLETDGPALAVRVADFNDDGISDLAVLTSNGVSIYLGNGKGGFSNPVTYDAGSDPTGLSVADVNNGGTLDLIVSDSFGDALVLLGQGNGTFSPYRATDQTITLAVADLSGNGSKDVIFADQGLDRVVVDRGGASSTVLANQATGLLDPGAVKLADLNGDGIPDLIVANSGSNNVLIYPGLGNGQFGPAIDDGRGIFTGTNPVGITVADLTGNGRPDLVVADEGSNEVSVLLNQGNFNFTQGPRLSSGGIGPVSTIVGDFTGSSFPDIVVTNSGSNDVTLLPGVGQGFFDDQDPRVYKVGDDPVTSFVGDFNGLSDLVTVDAGSNSVTLYTDWSAQNSAASTISSGGDDPVTAFAFSTESDFEDMVVGNTGDGVMALFEGRRKGWKWSRPRRNRIFLARPIWRLPRFRAARSSSTPPRPGTKRPRWWGSAWKARHWRSRRPSRRRLREA